MHQSMFSTSLIVTTYNNPDALYLCLQSILQQSVQPGELLIADDGSGEPTKQLVVEFSSQIKIPVKHVWQEDDGFRLSGIRNKAFAQSAGDYIIQIDGDLILHRHFIKDHIAFAKPGYFVSGARTNIDHYQTELLLQQGKTPLLKFFSKGLRKRYNAFHNIFFQHVNSVLQTSPRNMHYVLGCNMAFWKKDLQEVNGYNEVFLGWGKEDNDITARLMNAGRKLRFLKFGAIVFHLWHKENSSPLLSENERLFLQSIDNKVTYVEKGMDQYVI
ncbi:MAG: glycosyltransferase family 2 protein [Ferruginibacter sp.]